MEDSRDNIQTVKLIGKGLFSKAYLTESNDVIIVTFTDLKNVDYTKEGISEFANGLNVPQIQRLGYTRDLKSQVYKMPYYKKLTKKDYPTAWNQAKILQMELNNAGNICGYNDNDKWLDSLYGKIDESIIESLREINYALGNYDSESYCFEFPIRNLKVDFDGNLILLDVIFNKKSAVEIRRNYN